MHEVTEFEGPTSIKLFLKLISKIEFLKYFILIYEKPYLSRIAKTMFGFSALAAEAAPLALLCGLPKFDTS